MAYFTIDEIKKHLNIDMEFTDDDEYILSLEGVSEAIVAEHIRQSLSDIAESNEGQLPAPIKHAILLLTGTYYANRESVTFASAHELPTSYEYLLSPYIKYGASQSTTCNCATLK